MAIIDNTIAGQMPAYDAGAPLLQAAQIQQQQAAARKQQFDQSQAEMGAEARGLVPYMNTPDFPAKWAETTDRLRQKGLIDDQMHSQWRNSPSPLILKQIIAKTESPELAFRKTEAQREQGNTDRSFLQQKQSSDRSFSLQKQNADREYELRKRSADRADEAGDKPILKEVTDPNTGATSIVRISPKGPLGPVDTGIKPQPAANPFTLGGKFNEGEGKAAGFTDRMLQSEAILSGTSETDAADVRGTSLTDRGLNGLPVVGNYLVSKEFQQYDQAKRDFINAQLRRESGAAISPTEFESADKQYFPRPGDDPDLIAQKRANRKTAIEAMGREGGRSYRPARIFASDGRVAYRPTNEAEYAKVPKGGRFVDPEGNVRIKP